MLSAHSTKRSPNKVKLIVHRIQTVFLVSIVLVGMFGGGQTNVQAATATWSPELTRYPYLTDVVNSFATVNFATDRSQGTGSTAIVRYGKVGEGCTGHEAIASRNPLTVNLAPEYQWKAILRVEPGAQYCYRPYYRGVNPEVDLLGTDPAPVFNTQLPAGSSDAFSFIVMGDWGYVRPDGTNPIQAALLATVANSGARFAVTVGDNVYPTEGFTNIPGQTQYGDLNAVGPSRSAVFGPDFWKEPGKSIPIFPAIGNHGFSQADQPQNHPHVLNFPQDNATALSGGRYTVDAYPAVNGTTPGNYASVWYAIDAGLARIYVLEGAWADTNAGNNGVYGANYDFFMAPGTLHWEWLKADLASHPAAIKVALFHYPMYSDSTNEPSDTYLQGAGRLEALLNQYNVQLLYSGHGHFYERNTKLGGNSFISYIVGGGGANLTALGSACTWSAFAFTFTSSGGRACGSAPVPDVVDKVHHIVKVTVNGGMVTVQPINAQGANFDGQTYDFTAGKEAISPSTPGSLTAAASGPDSVLLNWNGSTDNTAVRGYTIYRNGVLWDYVTGGATTYTDNRAIAGGSYSYQVDAFDIWGNHSGLSNIAVPGGTPPSVFIHLPIIMK